MGFIRKTIKSFTASETVLLFGSLAAEIILFLFLPERDWLSLAASVLGIIMIVFMAKGNILGQFFSIAFAVVYSVVSYREAYYGEMLAYLCINIPINVVAVIIWFLNPYKGGRDEVKINKTTVKSVLLSTLPAAAITFGSYFLLSSFGTSSIWLNLASLFTCIGADLLTWQRSKYYAIAFVLNDLIIIAMWVIASVSNISNIIMVACFVIFLINDVYGFVAWQKREKQQAEGTKLTGAE